MSILLWALIKRISKRKKINFANIFIWRLIPYASNARLEWTFFSLICRTCINFNRLLNTTAILSGIESVLDLINNLTTIFLFLLEKVAADDVHIAFAVTDALSQLFYLLFKLFVELVLCGYLLAKILKDLFAFLMERLLGSADYLHSFLKDFEVLLRSCGRKLWVLKGGRQFIERMRIFVADWNDRVFEVWS